MSEARDEEKFISATTIAGASIPVVEAVSAVMHGGVVGGIVALGASGLVWAIADEMAKKGRGIPLPAPSQSSPKSNKSRSEHGFLYRAINGRDQDDGIAQPKEAGRDDLFDFESDDDITLTKPKKNDGVFRFSELLASGFRPTINKIFVGRTMDGKDIFVAAKDLCHVALAGKTGGGKGSLERLIMVQLCYIGSHVLLLNPHYMRWVVADNGPQFDEDWTPFEGVNPRKNNRTYLEAPPIDCADFEPIGQHLAWAVETELQKRKKEGREGGKKFKPFFIVIDEWPSIVAKIREAPGHLGELLREGRKFGIFVILTSQDFQVKTLGMEGGSIRNCFLTVFYTGGDKTTAKELLHYEKVADIPENSLGKGVILIRCTGTNNEPVLARVPFVDNDSVYLLLGPSTFKKTVTAQQNEMEIVEPQVNWALEDEEPVQRQNTKQEVTLTLEQLLAIQGRLPVRTTDDLPESETQVIRSPYYEQTGQHLYWQQQQQPSQYSTVPNLDEYSRVDQIPTQVRPQSTRKQSGTTIPRKYQLPVATWNNNNKSIRKMATALNLHFNEARELVNEMHQLGLINKYDKSEE